MPNREVLSLGALGVGTLIGSAMPLLFQQLPPEDTALLSPFTATLIASLVVHLMAFAATYGFVHDNRGQAISSDWRQAFLRVPQLVSDAVDLSRRNSAIRLLLAETL